MIYRFIESIANWFWNVSFDTIANLLKGVLVFFVALFLIIMTFNAAPTFEVLGTFIGSHFLGFSQYQTGIWFSRSLLIGFYTLFATLTFFMWLNVDSSDSKARKAVRVASIIVGVFALGINMYSMYMKDKSGLKTESTLSDVVNNKGEFIGIDTLNNAATAKAIDDRKSAEAGLNSLLAEVQRQQSALGELRKRQTWYKAGSKEYREHQKLVSQAQEDLEDIRKTHSEQIGYVKELRDAEKQTIHNAAIKSERLKEVHEDTLDELQLLGILKGLFLELGFVGFAYLYVCIAGLSGFSLDNRTSKPNLIQTKPNQAPSFGFRDMVGGLKNKVTAKIQAVTKTQQTEPQTEPVREPLQTTIQYKPELVREPIPEPNHEPPEDPNQINLENAQIVNWYKSQFAQVANPEISEYKLAGQFYPSANKLFDAIAEKCNKAPTFKFSKPVTPARVKGLCHRYINKIKSHDN